jgi:UDP-glucose 4-epimerase
MAFEYVYAKDVGRAVDLAATCAMPKQFIFNVGSGVTTSFDDLIAAIRRKLPRLDVEIVPGTSPVSRTQHLDLSAAKAHLGWSPQFTLDTGLEDYIADLEALRDRA